MSHVCATCGLPDMGAEADKRKGVVLCATCGNPLDDKVLAGNVPQNPEGFTPEEPEIVPAEPSWTVTTGSSSESSATT